MGLINRKIIIAFLLALLFCAGCGKDADDKKDEQTSAGKGYDAPSTETAADETDAANADSTSADNSAAEINGVLFIGVNGSALTLYDDQTADYYWIEGDGVKEGNPWTAEDGRITVRLPFLNCEIYADTDEGMSKLTFQSDSINWDDELFIKVGSGSIQKKPSEDEYHELVQAALQKMKENAKSLAENDPETSKEARETSDETSSEMRPEFKEAMDSYEAFYNEYCKLLKQYTKNPADMNLLAKYTEMLGRLGEMDEKFKAWDQDEMNSAELKYYLKVSARIQKKLLKAAQ